MKVLFWNVDTQKDFMLQDGKLYVKGAETIIPTLAKLTKFADKEKIQVVSTSDYHTKNTKEISDTPDFVSTFPPHCMIDTIGVEFIKETRPDNLNSLTFITYQSMLTNIRLDKVKDKQNIVILKDAFDVFEGNKNTEKIVEKINPDVVVIYGVASDICVNLAVLGLAKRGYNVVVVADAIKELPIANMVTIVNQWVEYPNVKVKLSKEIIKLYGEIK